MPDSFAMNPWRTYQPGDPGCDAGVGERATGQLEMIPRQDGYKGMGGANGSGRCVKARRGADGHNAKDGSPAKILKQCDLPLTGWVWLPADQFRSRRCSTITDAGLEPSRTGRPVSPSRHCKVQPACPVLTEGNTTAEY